MPPFFSGFITIFFIIFVLMIVISISNTAKKIRKRNQEPIKKFNVDGKTYVIYSKLNYNRYYSNQVLYELRDSNGNILGSFNSLNDILVLLNLDEFPKEDIFNW